MKNILRDSRDISESNGVKGDYEYRQSKDKRISTAPEKKQDKKSDRRFYCRGNPHGYGNASKISGKVICFRDLL